MQHLQDLSHNAILLAQTSSDNVQEGFPLVYQILCIIFTAVFLLTFSIARDPRRWRRLYQAKMAQNGEQVSVNRNKRIDENLKRYGIIIAMIFLLADVTCFVLGVSYRHRSNHRELTPEEKLQQIEIERFKASSPS